MRLKRTFGRLTHKPFHTVKKDLDLSWKRQISGASYCGIQHTFKKEKSKVTYNFFNSSEDGISIPSLDNGLTSSLLDSNIYCTSLSFSFPLWSLYHEGTLSEYRYSPSIQLHQSCKGSESGPFIFLVVYP